MSKIKTFPKRLGALFLLSGLLFTNEWLFLATKLSFMSSFSLMQKVWIWLMALCAVLLVLAVFVSLVGVALENTIPGGRVGFRILVSVFTVFLLMLLLILLVNNFTFTIFDVGLQMLTVNQRRLIAFFLILVFLLLLRRNWEGQTHQPFFLITDRIKGKVSGLTAFVILLAAGATVAHNLQSPPSRGVENAEGLYRPNIVIIGSDAVEAAHMSVYGYHLNTTPFLLTKKNEFLLSENSFTNNTTTFGSIGALLTGKYPTTTRLYYAPQAMLGKNQYEHFPGLLQKHGYRALDMSVRWYADPKDMNLRHAFNEANFRTIYPCIGGLGFDVLCAKFPGSVLLIERIFDRVAEVLTLLNPLYAPPGGTTRKTAQPQYYIHKDSRRILRIGQPKHYYHDDEARIDEAIKFMSNTNNRPFFINLHLMGTHGPTYLSTKRFFSKGVRLKSEWQTEFYDDSILRLDARIHQIYSYLDRAGLLENTIIVITSDHGRDWTAGVRIPLLIRFPRAANHGVVAANTGRIDVAPTLLDFMGWEKPAWMEGRSMLAAKNIARDERPLFSAKPADVITHSGGRWTQRQPVPPFYSLGGVAVVLCNQFFAWSLDINTWSLSKIAGHTRPCKKTSLATTKEFQNMVRHHLAARGYDTATLQNPRSAGP